MKIHIITIFPEAFESYFSCSIMKNAISKWFFSLEFYKLNDFSDDKNKRVDDKAYWMHWQVIRVEPIHNALNFIFDKEWKKLPVVYLSPRGEILKQERVEKAYQQLKDDCIIICWHYEWIDERIIELYVDYHLSIWEYVISSWELASMVFIDSIVRNIKWVLSNEDSLLEESFSKKLNRQKEYPVYTKPRSFSWLDVPEVLLSWNHGEVEKWKKNNLI